MIDRNGSSNFRWVRWVVVVMVFAAASLRAQSYSLGPDSQPQDGVPKGTVTQYDAEKPTAFMVFLDGSGYLGDGIRVPVVLDNLIAKHEVPPMIGIFVDPGVLPAVSADVQNRFERVFEYDSLSERYSWFLLEELIPAVAK